MKNEIEGPINGNASDEPLVEHAKIDPKTYEIEKTPEVPKTEESTLIFTLEKARNIYIEKGLKGNIEITRSLILFYRSVECDVDGPQEKAHLSTQGHTHILTPAETQYEKMILACVHRCIGSLTRRAGSYADKPYSSDLTLSNTVYATIPIFGFCSISVTCSATVKTLLNTKNNSKVTPTQVDNGDVMWFCCI